MFKTGTSWALLAPLFLSSLGCGDAGGAAPLPPEPLEVAKDARVTYAQIVLASYEDSLDAAVTLDAELTALVEDPSENTLEAARGAWLASREPYLQTEVYRFYDGPIDDPDSGPEGLLNAWPLDENYIDYVVDDPDSGIVNDPSQEISFENLSALNEFEGEKNISTGYHAIEFLLWGQDLSEDGPGDRPFTDYVTDGSGTAQNQDRRGEYLVTVSDLMNDHLFGLVDAWSEDDSSNYRAEFLRADPEESLRRMLTGMILLSGNETGLERIAPALDTGEQEEEHSCFSDNTHRDMIQDVQGVLNVWHGTYTRLDGSEIDGTGVRDVVDAQDRALAAEIDEKLDECLDLANALEPPFDREISPGNDAGNDRVEALLIALGEVSELFEEAFREFGLEVPEPP